MIVNSKIPGTNKLDVMAHLEYAARAVKVLRGLTANNDTMRHIDLGRAVGLIGPDERWQPWHRQQVGAILKLVAAVDRHNNRDQETLEYHRIVGGDGKPGTGVTGTSRLNF
jgi:hypothetical protein